MIYSRNNYKMSKINKISKIIIINKMISFNNFNYTLLLNSTIYGYISRIKKQHKISTTI